MLKENKIITIICRNGKKEQEYNDHSLQKKLLKREKYRRKSCLFSCLYSDPVHAGGGSSMRRSHRRGNSQCTGCPRDSVRGLLSPSFPLFLSISRPFPFF